MKRVAVACMVFALMSFPASFVRASPPQISNGGGASNIKDLSTTLHGELIDLGEARSSSIRVYVYWGLIDGGTVESAWSSCVPLRRGQLGPFSIDVSGLAPDTTYCYRCMAYSTGGTGWAPASTSFRTCKTGRASAPYIWRLGYDKLLAQADLGGLQGPALKLSFNEGSHSRFLPRRNFSGTSVSFGYPEGCARYTLRDSTHFLVGLLSQWAGLKPSRINSRSSVPSGAGQRMQSG